jgi:hypothetical protein
MSIPPPQTSVSRERTCAGRGIIVHTVSSTPTLLSRNYARFLPAHMDVVLTWSLSVLLQQCVCACRLILTEEGHPAEAAAGQLVYILFTCSSTHSSRFNPTTSTFHLRRAPHSCAMDLRACIDDVASILL